MKYYIEVTLLPSAEIPLYFLWEKLYQQVHLALVEVQNGDGAVSVGVSFPEYDAKQFQLGPKFRLFAGAQSELEKLDLEKWLYNLSDYVHCATIKEVPGDCSYVRFKRVQPKGNTARLARRKAKREGVSFEQAMQALAGRKEQVCKAPYIHIKSLSSDKRYRLMISCEDGVEQSDIDQFSTYGLSSNSTVPWFR